MLKHQFSFVLVEKIGKIKYIDETTKIILQLLLYFLYPSFPFWPYSSSKYSFFPCVLMLQFHFYFSLFFY